jgi:dihydroxyacetone kinase
LSIAETIENSVGGTSSAIYCIYLNALAGGLLKHSSSAGGDVWILASRHALNTLMTYTKARVGDRTLMDTLCPFIDKLEDLNEALKAAQEGSNSTCHLSAKLGRSSYLDNDQVLDANIPDAGAYGLAVLLTGLVHGISHPTTN